jgi:hypothetical protein
VNVSVVGARTALADRVVLAAAALILEVLGLTGWALFAGGGLGAPGSRPARLVCSECGDDIPYTNSRAGTRCVACEKGVYTPAPEGKGRVGTWGKVFILVLLGAVLIQGLLLLAVWRLRLRRRAAALELNRKLVCRCPFCRRRVAYPPALIGTGVVCRQCKTAYTLPAADQAELEEAIEG